MQLDALSLTQDQAELFGDQLVQYLAGKRDDATGHIDAEIRRIEQRLSRGRARLSDLDLDLDPTDVREIKAKMREASERLAELRAQRDDALAARGSAVSDVESARQLLRHATAAIGQRWLQLDAKARREFLWRLVRPPTPDDPDLPITFDFANGRATLRLRPAWATIAALARGGGTGGRRPKAPEVPHGPPAQPRSVDLLAIQM